MCALYTAFYFITGLISTMTCSTSVKYNGIWINMIWYEIRFGTCSVRSLYSVGSLTAAARELARYKLDLEGVQEVRWDSGGMVRACGL